MTSESANTKSKKRKKKKKKKKGRSSPEAPRPFSRGKGVVFDWWLCCSWAAQCVLGFYSKVQHNRSDHEWSYHVMSGYIVYRTFTLLDMQALFLQEKGKVAWRFCLALCMLWRLREMGKTE